MGEKIRWGAALLFYLIYISALVLFVIEPALKLCSWRYALSYGACFGLACYATYDLTNLATLNGWPVQIVVYDLIWGTFISSMTSLITFWWRSS